MKAKHAILLIALGFCLDYLGSFLRLWHWGEAQTIMFVATVLKVGGLLLLAYKVITYDGFKRFMER